MSPGLSQRRLVLSGGVAILIVALLAVLHWTGLGGGRAGPSVGGKTLRQWVDDMASQSASVQTQAIASVRSIGTNALPTLTEWMAHQDADYQREFYQFLRSKRAMVSMWPTLMGNSEDHCEYRALLGFYALGPEARPALPALQRLVRADNSTNPAKALNAAQAYVYVDPSEAERLAEQWESSTDRAMIAAATRLRSALARVQAGVASSNQAVQRTGASRSGQETNRTSPAAGSRR